MRSGQLLGCGVVRVEVVRGVVDRRQKSCVEEFLDLVPDIVSDDQMWKDAAELAWTMDREGKVIPATDVVIAACALRAGAEVVTLDPHFDSVPGLRHRVDLPRSPIRLGE